MLDVAIIGGGPAGLTAGLYAARAGLSCELFEGGFPGGQQATTNLVENYPGFPEGIGGPELSMAMQGQAERFGLRIRYDRVERVELQANPKRLFTVDGQVEARTVILCMGATPRPLGAPGEDRLRGRGVSYCATCDGAFYKGKDVAVVGGGDTAAEDALFLARIANSVTVIHRRDSFRAAKVLVRRMEEMKNIRFAYDTVVEEFLGQTALEGLRLKNLRSGQESRLPVAGVFVAVGNVPGSELVRGQVALDEGGYVLAGEDTHSSVPGVFAAGDIRKKPLRQIVCAVSDGAVAAGAAQQALL